MEPDMKSRAVPPPPPSAAPSAQVDARAMGRMRQDEMRRKSGGAQVLAGETMGSTVTGTKKLLGE
jgi:hypothetical protein